jgi:hypothetical protein
MFCDGEDVFAVTPSPKRFNRRSVDALTQPGIVRNAFRQYGRKPFPPSAEGMPSSVAWIVMVWLLVEDVTPPYSLASDASGVFPFETALVVPFAPVGAPVWVVAVPF